MYYFLSVFFRYVNMFASYNIISIGQYLLFELKETFYFYTNYTIFESYKTYSYLTLFSRCENAICKIISLRYVFFYIKT